MANLVKCSQTKLLKRKATYLDGFLRTQKALLGVEFRSQKFYLLPSAGILIKTQLPLGRGTRSHRKGDGEHIYHEGADRDGAICRR